MKHEDNARKRYDACAALDAAFTSRTPPSSCTRTTRSDHRTTFRVQAQERLEMDGFGGVTRRRPRSPVQCSATRRPRGDEVRAFHGGHRTLPLASVTSRWLALIFRSLGAIARDATSPTALSGGGFMGPESGASVQ
jgi:hypothetical protein